MRKGLEDKKKVLIAISDRTQHEEISREVSSRLARCQFYFATDGSEALAKIDNDAPDILIVEENLSRFNGIQITERILSKRTRNIAVIILSNIPDQDRFVDEVVAGQVQFMARFDETASKFLARAMNFVTHGDKAEFYLRFIAIGEVLMREGDTPDYVYILKKGKLQATAKRNGKNMTLGVIEAGEFVGEMSYINEENRNASIIALNDCELIEIPIDQMDHLLFQKPAWSRALLKTLSKRVKINNEKIAGN